MTEQSFKLKNSQTGNYWQIINGKRVYFNKENKQIDEAVFLQSENAKINKDGKIQSNKIYIKGSTSGRYYTIENGVRHYFAANGDEIKESYFFQQEGVKKNEKGQLVKVKKESVQAKSAKIIAKNLKKATEGWNDNDAIKAEMSKVDNAEELKELEKQLSAAGYKADDMYSSVEKFLYEELDENSIGDNSFEYLEQLVQKWIQNGVLKGDDAIKAQARLAARIIRDGGDGMGTDKDEIKRGLHLIKTPKSTGKVAQDEINVKKVYQEVQRIIKNAHNETLEEYLVGEVSEDELKSLKGIMAQNSAVQGKTKQQAIADLLIEAVEGAGTDVEELKEALKGIKSPQDRVAINAMLQKYCKEKGINGQIKGQNAIQAIMYDELDGFAGVGTNHEEIRKFNEMMISQGAYNKTEAVSLRAQQAALQILEGDMDNIKDALENIKDKEVLKAVNTLLTTKGYSNIDAYLAKIGKTQEEQDIANSILAKKKLLTDEKAAEVATNLLLNKDFDIKANGVRAIVNDKIARLVDEKLHKSNTSLAKVLNEFNTDKEKYKSTAAYFDFNGGILGEFIADQYKENTDISDNLYLESSTPVKTISKNDKKGYEITINKIESDLNKLKEDYQAALDTQGSLSAAVDYIASAYNLGTNRDDIEARIAHEEESLRLYKLASEGKLSKFVDGKEVPVTFEEIFKERQSMFVTGAPGSLSATINNVSGKETTEYNSKAIENVAKQGERMAAMNMAKDIISSSWIELNNGLKSKDENELTISVYNGVAALSKLNPNITLATLGLQYNGTNILDSTGKKLSTDKLVEIAKSLKEDYSKISKEVFNKDIPSNTQNDEINKLLEDGYDEQLEGFKEEYKKAFGQEPTDEMLEDYLTTVSTGVMIVNIGAAIGATILTAGYGSLAIFAAVGGTSAGLNMLEHSTDANGLTNDEFAQDMEQAIWDGALGAVGVKVGQYAEKFATNAEVLLKNKQFVQNTLGKVMNLNSHQANRISYWVTRVEAAGGEISSDALQALAQQYCMNGEIDEAGFVKSMLMSAGFNTVGHLKSGISSTPTKGTIKDLGKEIKADLVTDVKQSQSLLEGKPITAEGLKAKSKTDAATTENSYQLNKVEEKEVSPEFRQGMSQIEDAVKTETGNTIGEMLENNPWFAQFKDQLEGLEDYTVVALDDATKTARGSHTVSKKTGRQIALNINALKNNEEAFVNTLMHEAEHARQHKKYVKLVGKKLQTPDDKKYIEAYRAMDKADKARQEFYQAHSKEINKFVDDIQGKTADEVKEIISKYDKKQQEVCQKYMKLYNDYKNSVLEVEARDAGTEAVKTYNKNKEVNNGQEDRGSNPVREGDTTGDSDRSVGSDTRDKSVEQGQKGTEGTKETKVETNKNNTQKTKTDDVAKEIETFTPNNYKLTRTYNGLEDIAGATGKTNWEFVKNCSDMRNVLNNDATENWKSVKNDRNFGDYDYIKIETTDRDFSWLRQTRCIVYQHNTNTTSIVFSISGRSGDNITFHFDGKVSEQKCRDFINYWDNRGTNIFDEQEFLDFMNNKTTADAPVKPVETTNAGKVESDAPVKTDAASNPEVATPARAEGSIENGKIFFNGQEFDIPKTAKEAKTFAKSHADNVEIYDKYEDGRIDLDFYNKNRKIIATVIYNKNGNIYELQEFTFDKQGKDLKTTYKNPDGSIKSINEDIYTPDGNPNGTIFRKSNGELDFYSDINRNHYHNNPQTKQFELKDKDGNVVKYGVYDETNHTFTTSDKPFKIESEAPAPKADDVTPVKSEEPANTGDIDVDTPVKPEEPANTGNVDVDTPVRPEEPANTGDIDVDTPVRPEEPANTGDVITPARAEGSIEGDKIYFNGQEFPIPKTADEAIAFADSQGDNVTIFPFWDGSIDLEFRNEQNKIIVELGYNNSGKLSNSGEYTYNEKGEETSIIYKDADGKVTDSKEYTYNEKGKETSTIYKDADGKVTSSEEYTYNENEQQTSTIYKDADGKVTSSEEYTYNENGKQTSTIYKDNDGKVTGSAEYVSNENGQQTSTIYKDADGKVTSSEEYTYNEKGEETSIIYKDANGNPIKYKVEENGKWVEKPLSEIPTQQNYNNPHVTTKTKKDGTTIETTKYGDDKKVVTRDKDNNVTSKELYHKGKKVSAEYLDENGNMVYETYADGKLVKQTGINKKGNTYQATYDGKKSTWKFTKPGETKPFEIDTWNGNKRVKTEIYSNDGEKLLEVNNYNSKGGLSNRDVYADDGVQIKRHEEYYGDYAIGISYNNGQPSQLKTYTWNKSADNWTVKDTYSYNSATKDFELKGSDGKVKARATYNADTHEFSVKEGDKKPKVYNHESSHKARKAVIGTIVAGGAAYGIYEAMNSENSGEEVASDKQDKGTGTGDKTKTGGSTEAGDGNKTGDGTEAGDGNKTGDGTETGDGNKTGESTEAGDGTETGDGNKTGESTEAGDGNKTGESTEAGDKTKTGGSTGTDDGTEAGKAAVVTSPEGGKTPVTTPVVTAPEEGKTPVTTPVVTAPEEGKTPVTTPVTKPVEETPQEEKSTVKPTIKESDLVNGRDPETGKKREITSIERMEITQHIEQAKNEEDLKLIQEEMRSFKVFKGRKNLRRALKAKRKMFNNPESERREDKYENRMDKIENSKVFQEDLIKIQYDYTEPENKKENDLDNPFYLA